MAEFDTRHFIEAAKRGEEPAPGSIARFMEAFMQGQASDAQAAAWLMAVCLKGLSDEGAIALTGAMLASGETVDLSGLPHTADKHSTGGVGDKTTLVACPIAAAAGVTVAKMSGRGLGHTGGTIDKLEAIPGLRTALAVKALVAQARTVGLVIAAATESLAPADKRLYHLRHMTATVDSIPLIAASVMSKKLAGGASAIVLDVKHGQGAFAKQRSEARHLAELLVRIGRAHGRNTAAALTPMDQPLGSAVGHALEVREAISALCGQGPDDLVELSMELAARMILESGVAKTPADAAAAAGRALSSGAALERLRAMVKAQGGDVRVVDDPSRLPRAPMVETLKAPVGGVVTDVSALRIAAAVAALGGVRKGDRDVLDHAVGIRLHRKVGEDVARGDPLAEIHAASPDGLAEAREHLTGAIRIGDAGPPTAQRFGIEWVN